MSKKKKEWRRENEKENPFHTGNLIWNIYSVFRHSVDEFPTWLSLSILMPKSLFSYSLVCMCVWYRLFVVAYTEHSVCINSNNNKQNTNRLPTTITKTTSASLTKKNKNKKKAKQTASKSNWHPWSYHPLILISYIAFLPIRITTCT